MKFFKNWWKGEPLKLRPSPNRPAAGPDPATATSSEKKTIKLKNVNIFVLTLEREIRNWWRAERNAEIRLRSNVTAAGLCVIDSTSQLRPSRLITCRRKNQKVWTVTPFSYLNETPSTTNGKRPLVSRPKIIDGSWNSSSSVAMVTDNTFKKY